MRHKVQALAGVQWGGAACRDFGGLPAEARFIEKFSGVRVGLIGAGTDREDKIFRDF